MTRVNLPENVDFEFISDAELSTMIADAIAIPEIQLEEANVISENDLEYAEPLFDFTEAEWITELDLAFESVFTPTDKFERGVGYCENVECEDYLKSQFLFMHEGKDFKCDKCHQHSTHMVAERGIPEREGMVPFASIRVEYCYEPAKKRFEEIVVITDESYEGPSGIYTILNPLCKTPRRAERIAEAMLTVINEGVFLDEDLSTTPKHLERILSFDKSREEFRKDLKDLEHSLRDNSFLQRTSSVVSTPIEVELNLEEGGSSGPESSDAGRTTNPQPRVLPSGNSRAGTLHVHSGDQSGSARPERSEGGLHPVQHLGRRSEDLRREPSEGRRGGNYWSTASKLCAAARRYLSDVVRNKGGRGSSRT